MADDIVSYSSDDPQGVVSGRVREEDLESEIVSLRPRHLIDYVGQSDVVETLKIAIEAALQRNEPIDHVLLHGPPGLGKTTLAHIIANETGSNLTLSSGPALEKGGDLIGILTHSESGDILFIDEIHRLPKPVEELLYPAMEDFAIDFVFDKGVHARSHRFRLKRFTLVGATTRVGHLSAPLRDRFGIFRSLDFYSLDDLVRITRRSADVVRGALLGTDLPGLVAQSLRQLAPAAKYEGDPPEGISVAVAFYGLRSWDDYPSIMEADDEYCFVAIGSAFAMAGGGAGPDIPFMLTVLERSPEMAEPLCASFLDYSDRGAYRLRQVMQQSADNIADWLVANILGGR